MELEPFTPSCLDRAPSPLFTLLAPISSTASPLLGLVSYIDQFENQTQPTTSAVPACPTTSVLPKKSLPFPTCYPETEDGLRQPSSLLRRDVRPLQLHPRHVKSQLQADEVTLHRQHKREYLDSRARAIKRPRYNRRLQYELKPELSSWKKLHWDNARQEFTLKNLSLPSQQIIVPLKANEAQQN